MEGGRLSAEMVMVWVKVAMLLNVSFAVHVRVKVPALQVSGGVVCTYVNITGVQSSAVTTGGGGTCTMEP